MPKRHAIIVVPKNLSTGGMAAGTPPGQGEILDSREEADRYRLERERKDPDNWYTVKEVDGKLSS